MTTLIVIIIIVTSLTKTEARGFSGVQLEIIWPSLQEKSKKLVQKQALDCLHLFSYYQAMYVSLKVFLVFILFPITKSEDGYWLWLFQRLVSCLGNTYLLLTELLHNVIVPEKVRVRLKTRGTSQIIWTNPFTSQDAYKKAELWPYELFHFEREAILVLVFIRL